MNATINESIASCSSLINPTAEIIGKTIAYCLILVVSLVENFFIALIVYKTQGMRKPINFFIVNMAMSDFLFPIFVFPKNLTYLYAESWVIGGPLGQALCKLYYYFLVFVSTGVSIQSLVLIAVDRFGAVVFPLRSPLISLKMCPIFILATWIVGIAVFWPLLLVAGLVEDQGQQYCRLQPSEVFEELSSLANYFLAIQVVLYYIPIALLAILYSIILIKLNLQTIPGEQSVNADAKRARRNRNVLKMAIAIVLGFVLCWLPYSIYILLIFFAPDSLTYSCGFKLYSKIAVFICSVNCAINPCICFIFSENYRRGLKKLLK